MSIYISLALKLFPLKKTQNELHLTNITKLRYKIFSETLFFFIKQSFQSSIWFCFTSTMGETRKTNKFY